MPKVSISCVTYNHEPFLRECFDGFLMQQCDFEFEILVYDDASTDKTQEIITEYQSKHPGIFKPILQTENQWSKGVRGINVKFNFPRVKGKYIALCEGDDYWIDPLKLQKQVDFLEQNQEIGLVHTNYKILNENTSQLLTKKVLNRNNENEHYHKTGDIRFLTVLFRSKYLTQIQELFNQDFMLKSTAADRALFMLISTLSKLHFLNFTSGVYRIGTQDSASNFQEKEKEILFKKNMTELNISLFDYLAISKHRKKFEDGLIYYTALLKYKKNFFKTFYLLIRKRVEINYFKQYIYYLIKG